MSHPDPTAGAPALIHDFAAVIAPVSLDEFFSVYWQRRPLHMRGPAGRFAGLFDRKAFHAALPGCQHLKAGFYDRKGWYCELPITADQVKRLWEAEMTICAGVLPPEGPRMSVISAYRRAVTFAGEAYFNAYMSPNGHGFALHIDDHPVFILQVEGMKRWWFSPEIGVPEPVRGFQFPPDRDVLKAPWGVFQRPDESAFREITLEPGDVLYLPPGTWHKARAVGFSLALTLASSARPPLELAQQAMMAALGRYPALYQRLWGGDARPLATAAGRAAALPAFEQVVAALQDWASRLDAESVQRLWHEAARPKE